MPENIEREVKFLNIDAAALKAKLAGLGAKDEGENLLREVIFYPVGDLKHPNGLGRRLIRIRQTGDQAHLAYKNRPATPSLEVEEIELEVNDPKKAEVLLVALGWEVARRQEKKRHTFQLDPATIDIDTWPGVPPYVEIEGPNEQAIKKAAEALGFDWSEALLMSSAHILKQYYGISVWDLTKFSFDGIE